MKVIGLTTEGCVREYICTVQHSELEKFMNLYYGKMKHLQVGATVDLGKGYDHAATIASALDKTRSFVKEHQAVITAICGGLSIEALARAAQEAPLQFGSQENAA